LDLGLDEATETTSPNREKPSIRHDCGVLAGRGSAHFPVSLQVIACRESTRSSLARAIRFCRGITPRKQRTTNRIDRRVRNIDPPAMAATIDVNGRTVSGER
jgi:hypothetical protein